MTTYLVTNSMADVHGWLIDHKFKWSALEEDDVVAVYRDDGAAGRLVREDDEIVLLPGGSISAYELLVIARDCKR